MLSQALKSLLTKSHFSLKVTTKRPKRKMQLITGCQHKKKLILDNVLGNFTSGSQLSLMKTLHQQISRVIIKLWTTLYCLCFLKFQTSSYLGSERLGTGLWMNNAEL